MEIRAVSGEELLTTALPLQEETFTDGPAPGRQRGQLRDWLPYLSGDTTLIVSDAGTTLAAATAIPMRQNVRGLICPMAGISGVATHVTARRRGHTRALLTRLLGDMREAGHAVSALYPFRPSFYERFGYAGLARPRTLTFAPEELAPLLRMDLPGEVSWQPAAAGYDAYLEFTAVFLAHQHGFAVFPGHRAARLRDAGERWLLLAQAGGGPAGALSYRIASHGGELIADALLATGPVGRALLLQFLARYIDQVTSISMTIGPGELPELWLTDFANRTESRTAIPYPSAPMARVLSVPALAGLPAGEGRVTVEVTADPFIAGRYLLDGGGGRLAVSRASGTADVTLTPAGLAALVYGVLDPAELALRGFGSVPAGVAATLRAMFPRCLPFVAAGF